MHWLQFTAFLQIGLFSFGGGYCCLPLIQETVVTRLVFHGQLLLLITISQTTPLHCHQFGDLGRHIAGLPGAVTATFGRISAFLFWSLPLPGSISNTEHVGAARGARFAAPGCGGHDRLAGSRSFKQPSGETARGPCSVSAGDGRLPAVADASPGTHSGDAAGWSGAVGASYSLASEAIRPRPVSQGLFISQGYLSPEP